MKKFRDYEQDQGMLFPPHLSEFIPETHVVRIVNKIFQQMDLTQIIQQYQGGGAPSYDPEMMLKVLVYAYMEGIYTGRRIAKALRENINYMWLSGMQKPDFRTINLFRSNRLSGNIKSVFKQVVDIGEKLGLLDFSSLFVDGTKMEANSNQHKMVWKKNTMRFKKSVEDQIDELFEEIDRLNEEEDRLYKKHDLPEMGRPGLMEDPETQEKIDQCVENINKELNSKKHKALERKKKSLKKKIVKLEQRLANYEEQEKKFQGRTNFSKTDPDATFMRMKNGQLKPGYNWMIGTQNQFIVNYEVEQKPSDGSCFTGFMNEFREMHGKLPGAAVGDQAFGNEENYQYCDDNEVTPYLKFGLYFKENTKKYREDPYRRENLEYDCDEDEFTCPAGEKIQFSHRDHRITKTGFVQINKTYLCRACPGCEHQSECTRGQFRHVIVNESLERYKARARKLLSSEKGREFRRMRGCDVETVFGNIKQNGKFTRFNLRGLENVSVEAGILAIAHNIKKITSAQAA